jgi:hypothetical protein
VIRKDIEQDIPLSEAVSRANQRIREHFGTEFSEQGHPSVTASNTTLSGHRHRVAL